MTEQPRDWDRELADIDRVIAKQGGAPPSAAPAPTPPSRGAPAPPPQVRRRSVAMVWFWALLALALAVALPLWPYERACGLQLIFFLGAAGVTALIGLLGALESWAHHRGLAHILSLLVVVWAAAVALREVLPRVGYAKETQAWMCEAAPATAAPAPPAQ
jgi:hypothetical protein